MEYDIMCKDCSLCLVDYDHPKNANPDSPQRGLCSAYMDDNQNPIVTNMSVAFKQCMAAKRGKCQPLKKMPDSGPPRSDESREERIERLKRELQEAEDYKAPETIEPDDMVPAGSSDEEEKLREERDRLKAQLDKLTKNKV